MLMERMDNGEMRMLSDELRIVRLWHSGLERAGRTEVSDWKGLDAQQCRIGKGWMHSSVGLERVGRTAVSDWKGLDAQQCVPTSLFH